MTLYIPGQCVFDAVSHVYASFLSTQFSLFRTPALTHQNICEMSLAICLSHSLTYSFIFPVALTHIYSLESKKRNQTPGSQYLTLGLWGCQLKETHSKERGKRECQRMILISGETCVERKIIWEIMRWRDRETKERELDQRLQIQTTRERAKERGGVGCVEKQNDGVEN